MNIVAAYDSSVANAPAAFKSAVQTAISYLDNEILNPVTVTIMFSYGEIDGSPMASGALGESLTNGYIEPFSQLVSWLTGAASSEAAKASIDSLPASDPTGGARFWVSDAEAKVFGDGSNPNFTDPEDGFVALSSTAPLDYNATDRSVAGQYDVIGILEHEITEALGRISYLGQAEYGGFRLYSPMDLFRYASAGVHVYSPGSGYFSVNGTNLLLEFNNPRDGGDWASSSTPDAFDAFSTPGEAETVSPTDLLLMNLLGFDIASPARNDFNDDQKSDFLIENAAGAVAIGEVGSNDAASFSQVGALGPEWSFKGAGDFLGDGDTGFLIENTAGAVVVGEVSGGQASYSEVASLGPEWSFEGVGDLLGDGLSDFLIENTSGVVAVGEVQNGHAAYSVITSLGSEWSFVGVGDFLDDGQSQFLIENTAGAVVVGEVRGGQADFTQVASLGPEWRFEGAGDFLAQGGDQFLIENTSGAVVVGDWTGGQIHFTQVASLGAEWIFH